MQVPLQIAFRNMDHDPALEEEIRRKAEKLEEFSDHITACTVTVEAPHQHHRRGNLYEVRIHLALPRHHDVVVDRERGINHSHKDVHVAIRDAFDDARRQLQDEVRALQGVTKTHAAPAHGHIRKLFPHEGYGFLETPDGREVYFHANSVVDVPFEELSIGDDVRYVEEKGELAPQANMVKLVGRYHQLH